MKHRSGTFGEPLGSEKFRVVEPSFGDGLIEDAPPGADEILEKIRPYPGILRMPALIVMGAALWLVLLVGWAMLSLR